VDKTLILNNLELPPHDDRGVAYDASGKGKAAATLTGAAQANGSGANPRGRNDGKKGRTGRHSKGKNQAPPATAPPRRNATLAPEENLRSGKGFNRRGRRAVRDRAAQPLQ
jgi:hypothetical protein